MFINATKNLNLFLLSLLSLCGSVNGMMLPMIQVPSTIVLSDIKVKIGTLMAGIACTAGVALKNENLDGKNIFIAAGIGTFSALGAYLCLDQLTPEKQLKRYFDIINKIEQHKIIKKQKDVETLFNAGGYDGKGEVREFINKEFGGHTGTYHFASIGAVTEFNTLENMIKGEQQRLRTIQSNKKDEFKNEFDKLKNYKDFVKKVRGVVISSKQYREEIKVASKARNINLKEQQITFINKIAAFIPMFTQPVSTFCMVLLQLFFNKLGIE
jgi:hypothetical protein